MDIRDIFRIIKKHWILITSVACIAIIGSASISYLILDNVYEADAVMIISSPEDSQKQFTLSDYNLNTSLVNSYRSLLKTDRILSQVLKSINLPINVNELSNKINVTSDNDTELIKIAVEDTDPATAAKIANAVATVFIKEIPQIMKMDNVQLIDNAVPPQTPTKPNRKMIIAISMLLGFLLGFGIAFLIDYLDVSIKTSEQLEKILEVPILGIIPNMKER